MVYLHSVIFLLGVGITEACTSNDIFVPTNADATIQYTVVPPGKSELIVYEWQFNSQVLVRIKYYYGTVVLVYEGVVFTGNASTGYIKFKIENVDDEKAGKYVLKNVTGSVDLACTTLYVLGKPSKASVTGPSDPEILTSVTFSCSSSSNTHPTGHQLNFNYDWIFDSDINPENQRFTYGHSKQTMKISDVVKDDQNKTVQCQATEIVDMGLTSDRSEPIFINVLYGPDNLVFIPNKTRYALADNQPMNDVKCEAECNPPCGYTWKHRQSTTLFETQTLSLGQINVLDAGTYICNATRVSFSASKELQVDVIYGPLSVDLEPSKILYREDENTTMQNITCSAQCWPCEYKWTGPRPLPNGAILSLGILDRSEHGRYSCTATNRNTSTASVKYMTIEVRYGPDMVSLSPDQESVTVNEGDGPISDRRCFATCFPQCIYTWKKPARSSASSTAGTLMFTKTVNRTDGGTYVCTATNQVNTGFHKTIEFTILVQYGPDKVDLQPPKTVYTENVGHILNNITCSSKCSPSCVHTWVKDINKFPLGADILMLDSLKKEEKGNYTCIASNPKMTGSASITVTVNIRYGPDAIELQPNKTSHTVVEGQRLQDIKCFAECYPNCTEKWINVSSADELLNEAEGVLSLGIVNRFYTGDYRCRAKNQALEYQHSLDKTVTVTVNYIPDVFIFLERGQNSHDDDDKTAIFVCNATGLPAEYTFASWVHFAPDNITRVGVYNGTTSGNQNRLMLTTLSYMDSGFYICNVTNSVEELSTGRIYATNGIEFTQKGEPQILPTKSRASAALGSSCMLSTSFYSNDDREPSVSWFRIENHVRKELLNDTTRYSFNTSETVVTVLFYSKEIELLGYHSVLTILDIIPEDYVSYRVEVNNSVGYNSSTFSLEPEGPPETPMYFDVSRNESTSSSVTLTWHSGFYGGASQTFHIKYRQKGSEEWHLAIDVFGGEKENKPFNATVNGLVAGTSYEFLIYASNKFNRSDVSVTEGNTTAVQQVEDQAASSNIGLIAGGAAGGAAVAAIIVVVVSLFRRRRQDYSKSSSKSLLKDKERQIGTNGADDTAEINLNPMYDSAGPPSPTLNNSEVYSQVNKNKKKPKPVGDVYSQVDKPKKRQTTGGSEVKNDVYAEVQKTTHKENNAGKPKPKTQKLDKKTKKGKQTEDLYDNVDSMNSTVSKDDTVYENPSCSIEDEHPKQIRNQDVLVYADLDLPTETIGKGRRAVIHGLDDRTDYADIKFGEVGEQAPESDDENTRKE